MTLSDTLVKIALEETDFLGDLDPDTLEDNAANSADRAEDIYTDREGGAVSFATLLRVRTRLIAASEAELQMRERAEQMALADAIEAGDRDRHGNYIPYARYP